MKRLDDSRVGNDDGGDDLGGAPTGPGQESNLSRRISLQLMKIIRPYVVLLTVLVMVIMVLAGFFYNRNELRHQRELVLTKVETELSNTGNELQALASAPVVWTGLTDSFGREAYLEPLLLRFTHGQGRQLVLLDYRGRLLLAPDAASAQALADLAAVKEAVREGRNGFGIDPAAAALPRLLLIKRVVSPVAEAPVGFLVASVDAGALVRSLNLSKDAMLAFALGDGAWVPSASADWTLSEQGATVIRAGELEVPLSVWVGQPIVDILILVFSAVMLALALGLWTIHRVMRWARRFGEATTQRYDRLLEDCRRLLAGQTVETLASTRVRDELSDVTEALTVMLQQQKEFTDELRKTSLVFSTAAEGILVTDPIGRILDVNPALLAMTGFSREELIGRQSGALYRSVALEDSSRAMAETLDREGRWSGETNFLARNGRVIPAAVSISRIHDEAGTSQGHVAVITDVTRLKEAENKLRDLAYRDGLTGLPNYRRMSDEVRQLLTVAAGTGQRWAVLFFDMDRLKFINDNYGHEAGDAAIKAVASHLRAVLPRGHLLCRRSGDEFIAAVELLGEDGRDKLQLLLQALNPIVLDVASNRIGITVTLGISCFPEDGADWASLQICADVAMHEAKQRERGSVGWFDVALGRKVYRRRQIQSRLAQAIQDRAIALHYQPEVDLRTGALIGFEALARWTDPELGVVKASEFIDITDESHLSEAFTLMVMETVLRDKTRLQARFPGVPVAVNIAPQAFLGAGLLRFLVQRTDAAPGILDGLELELTESHIAASETNLLLKLQTLTGMGVRLVIDDFGTGYSSLSRLTQFPISRLKIDRSFVAGLEMERQMKIARLIINLARVMNFEVTAEGVETPAQGAALVEMGCVRGQGWLFAKAVPLDEALALPARFEVGPAPPT